METTQHTPADVRERVDVPGLPDGGNDATTCPGCGLPNWSGLCPHCRGDQDEYERKLVPPFPTSRPDEESAALLRAGRGGRSALWWAANELVAALEGRSTLTVQQCITGVKRLLAEADLRTPRGEGEGDTLWRDFEAALVELEAAAIALGRREALPLGPREAAIDRVVQARRRVIDCAHVLAALRSEAQGDETDALDLIRWAEARAAVLEPVVGNLTPPGTYACYVEGVGDDPAEYEDAGEPYMGPGILGAIRAARRGEGGGE